MGKTTLIKCINGLIPSFELGIGLVGAVRVCGLVPGTCETYELAKRVGSVFQNPKSQFYHLTSDDELVFGLENAGVDVGRIERRRSEVVSEMGIQRLLHRDVSKMSGGEKQALAFASVAVADPDVYVLDEPTANLDAAAINVLRRQIAGVVALGKTVIVAEHRLAFLHGIIDRAVLLEDGRIKRSMSSRELMGLSEKERASLGLRIVDPASLPAFSVERPVSFSAAPKKRGVSLRNFTVLRHGEPVFSPLNLDICPGEIVGLVGANGSGKSTLLRGLAGLERRTGGGFFLDAAEVPRRQRRKVCSMVMQDVNHQLFSDSVWGDCELSCPDAGKIGEVLGALDLLALSDRHPMSLSGGQRQRLAMADAILAGRPVVLLDEPTSGLDLRHMIEAGVLIKGIAAQGACVIVTTHDVEFLVRTCDRVYSLEQESNS
jgi:putative ABC transporter ATP-binding protein TDE_0282